MNKFIILLLIIISIFLVGCSPNEYDSKNAININSGEIIDFNNRIMKYGNKHLNTNTLKELINEISKNNVDENSKGIIDVTYKTISGKDYLKSNKVYDVDYIYDNNGLIKEVVILETNQ